MKTASFKGVRKVLDQKRRRGGSSNRNEALEIRFLDEFERLEGEGPAGWLGWLLDYRHTLVHRGRRISFWSVKIIPSSWYGPNLQRAVHTKSVLMLASAPSLSEAEAHAWATGIALKESAATTLRGALGSSIRVLEGAAFALALAWCTRRECPELAGQPAKQWTAPEQERAFTGWAPGEVEYDPDELHMNPGDVHRLRLAEVAKRP